MAEKESASAQDATRLFTRALDVINAALARHKDDTPYAQLLSASEKVLADRNIGVAVYEDDASAPFDYYTIRFREGTFELVSRGKQEPEAGWKVSRAYLEGVVEDADAYIEHPAKLDWDWLKSRVGLA